MQNTAQVLEKKILLRKKINNTCEIFSKMQNLRYGDQSDLSDETK